MRYPLLLLALAHVPALAAQRAPVPRGTLIVTNKSSSSASIISIASGQVVAELPTGNGPHEVAASRDGRWAVVSDYGAQTGGSTLTVIDVAERRVVRSIDLGSYTRPHGITFLPGDSLVAVTSEASQNVVIVSVARGMVVRGISTGQTGSHMLAVTGAADRIYTANIGANSVSELDVARGETVRMFQVPPAPEGIAVTPDGDQVWVGSNTGGVVSVVNTRDGTVQTAASGFSRPYRVLITPDRRSVLVPDFTTETLRVLDFASRTERGRVSLAGGGPQGLTVTPDSRTVFISLSAQDRVAIVDLESLSVKGYLPASHGPDGVAFSAIEQRP